MLDIKFIRENKEIVQEGARKKQVEIDIEQLILIDDERLVVLKEVEDLRSEVNKVSNSISRDQDGAEKMQLIEEMRLVKEDIKAKEEKLKAITEEWQVLMLQVPNVPSPDTPEGPDESGNVVIRNWGEKRSFDFAPKDHYELGKNLDILDNETAAEVSGARFTYIKGDLVLLQFSLINFLMMEIFTNPETLEIIAKEKNIIVSTKVFTPVIPPFMIKPNTYLKMARLSPKAVSYTHLTLPTNREV